MFIYIEQSKISRSFCLYNLLGNLSIGNQKRKKKCKKKLRENNNFVGLALVCFSIRFQ